MASETSMTTEVKEDRPTVVPALHWQRLLMGITAWVALLIVSACVFKVGIQLRRWAWEQTVNMHFIGDATHAYTWGSDSDNIGLFKRYRQIRADYGDQPPMEYGLDYTPLRLTIVTIWAHWVNQHFDGSDQWDPDKSYAFHRPILMFNAACEAAAAVGVVMVLRLMRKITRGGAAESTRIRDIFGRYVPLAVAALLVWFNPSLILNDCWPQWDCWILPFFVFALYFSMRDWWFTAGLMLGIGAMLKGQILFVGPIFLLWPLFSARWLSAARVVFGLAMAMTLIAIPWTLTSRGDFIFVSCGAVVALGILIYCRRWRSPIFQLLACAIFIIPMWLTPKLLTGDMSWFILPFEYGPIKHPEIATVGTGNLPAILHEQWGWEAESPVYLPIAPGHWVEIDLRWLLTGIYAICLLICAIAAAIQWRRRSPRFLLALYAPWVLFFSILPYLNNRYLLWGAALFPLLIPLGLGMTLLGVVICLSSCAMLIEIMCRFNSDSNPTLAAISHGLYPGLGFAVVLIAAIFLFTAANFRQRYRNL
jgi:hypothetical protein